jgi:hypothetical protein
MISSAEHAKSSALASPIAQLASFDHPLRHCFQFPHLGPNPAYASFGYRQSGMTRLVMMSNQGIVTKALGLDPPIQLLARTDEVIE